MIPVAEKRLKQISLPLQPPVVVIGKITAFITSILTFLGDASGSMEIAIKTATIISSLLTVLANAELRFFNGANFFPHVNPKTIKEVFSSEFH